MSMITEPNNINCNYDEQAKIMLDRFIYQLNTTSEKADDASADLKYTRALQRARLLTMPVGLLYYRCIGAVVLRFNNNMR